MIGLSCPGRSGDESHNLNSISNFPCIFDMFDNSPCTINMDLRFRQRQRTFFLSCLWGIKVYRQLYFCSEWRDLAIKEEPYVSVGGVSYARKKDPGR